MLAMADNHADARGVVIEWIQHILDRKQWTGTDLARHSNLAPSTILRLMNDPNHKFVPSLKTMQKIADGSGYPIPRKVTEAIGATRFEPAEAKDDMVAVRNREAATVAAGTGLRRPSMVGVRHVSSLPKSLHPLTRNEVSVALPAHLEGDETAFAFYNPDSALEPWHKAGSLMYATKRRDPTSGDIVLVTDQDGRSRVRLLLDIDETGLSLSRTHPAQEDERMAFEEIADIAVVAVIVKI